MKYKNVILIISPNTANWIVLDNSEQELFFQLLLSHSIEESLSLFDGTENNAKWVITQLEAKQFENTCVTSGTEGEQTLHFYLTNACNLRCPHCYMFAGKRNDNELDKNEIYNVLRQYSELGGKKVTFSGGEVMMRDDLLPIVRYAYENGLLVRILTNGTLWTKEIITEIAPLISSVQISVDGYSEETNAEVRGAHSFQKSLLAVEWFVDAGANVEIAITPFYNFELVSRIQNYANFAKELLTKYPNALKINIAHEVIEGRDIHLTEGQKKEYGEMINKILSEYYGYDISLDSFTKTFKEWLIMDNCMFGELSIASNGDVCLCARVGSVCPIGNIREQPLAVFMEKGKLAHRISDVTNLRPCNICELKYICGGGCRIDYFPKLTSCSDFEKLDPIEIPSRVCSAKEKEFFYEMMIRTNEMLFR